MFYNEVAFGWERVGLLCGVEVEIRLGLYCRGLECQTGKFKFSPVGKEQRNDMFRVVLKKN